MIRVSLLALCLCIFLFNTFIHAETVDCIAAIVNGEIITRSEIKERMQPYLLYAVKDLQGDERQEIIATIKKQILDDLIREKLLLMEAKNMGITIEEKKIDHEVNTLKKKLGTQKNFEELLTEQNITEEEFREKLRRQLLLRNLIDTVLRGTIESPSENDARQFYEENIKTFMVPGKFAISEITIKADDKRNWLEAKEAIEKIHKRILEGEDFATIARKYSCSPSASSGGRLGFVNKGELLPEFSNAISVLKVGQISNVIKTGEGFHIIKLESIKKPQQKEFNEVRHEIENHIYQAKMEKALGKWVDELKEKAYIHMLEE